jgi:hypothetical protein
MTAALVEEPPFYDVNGLRKRWNVSGATVRRILELRKDIMRISMPRLLKNRKHKPHVMLRIPASVVERIEKERSAGPLEVEKRRRII